MELKPSQEKAKDEVFKLLDEGHKRILLLGSAGTGKTFLASELMRLIKKSHTINTKYNNGLVYATAPTHKALSVLKSKIQHKVEFATIHSATDVKMGRPDKQTGVRSFTRIPSRNNPFPHAKAALLDECSMVENKLIKYLDELHTYNFPIVYLGRIVAQYKPL